jgi:hypothetical protein
MQIKNLLIPVAAHAARYPAAGEVVRRDLYRNPVAWQHADLVNPQLSSNVRKNNVSRIYLYTKKSIGKVLYNLALKLYDFLAFVGLLSAGRYTI